MPRLIDHDLRRAELAEAVWRVLARDGVGAVSVRSVAAEAGVSAGSLRHVLPSKELMLAAASGLVVERATARFHARFDGLASTGAEGVEQLCEMLPLDDVRRLELRAHLALMLESSDLRAPLDEAVSAGCRTVLLGLQQAGRLREDLDLDDEAGRLHLVVDGLALHLLGPAPRISAERARQVLREHLAALARTGG